MKNLEGVLTALFRANLPLDKIMVIVGRVKIGNLSKIWKTGGDFLANLVKIGQKIKCFLEMMYPFRKDV